MYYHMYRTVFLWKTIRQRKHKQKSNRNKKYLNTQLRAVCNNRCPICRSKAEHPAKYTEKDGEICGFQFAFKLQYYRGITLSIIRDIAVTVDGKEYPREDVLLTVNGETFDLEQTKTVVSPLYRWEFGDYATVTVKAPGGLSKGKHHISTLQHIAPSYMPFPIKAVCEADFEI